MYVFAFPFVYCHSDCDSDILLTSMQIFNEFDLVVVSEKCSIKEHITVIQ